MVSSDSQYHLLLIIIITIMFTIIITIIIFVIYYLFDFSCVNLSLIFRLLYYLPRPHFIHL